MSDSEERLRRWRLILGNDAGSDLSTLGQRDLGMDGTLDALYGGDGDDDQRHGNLGASAPKVSRWLGDIRTYFPSPVVRVMQKDALERLNLKQLLLEPELLESLEPDVDLLGAILSLNKVMPEKTRETARRVVRTVVEQLQKRLRQRTIQLLTGSLNRAARDNHHPKYSEIDWHKTIRANLRHYQPEYKTIIPERRFGFGRKQHALRDVILCVDQSGSMAASVVYSSIFGAVLASLRSLHTEMVVFDTSLVDLTAELRDPVDLLFATQLGGGTDINRALAYCQMRIRRPNETILVLISDLFEGGDAQELLRRVRAIKASGVQMVALLALNDKGAPSYHKAHAEVFAALGVPAFACTPDAFPELMAAAIMRRDLTAWVAANIERTLEK